jgi:hypothetical protein
LGAGFDGGDSLTGGAHADGSAGCSVVDEFVDPDSFDAGASKSNPSCAAVR